MSSHPAAAEKIAQLEADLEGRRVAPEHLVQERDDAQADRTGLIRKLEAEKKGHEVSRGRVCLA